MPVGTVLSASRTSLNRRPWTAGSVDRGLTARSWPVPSVPPADRHSAGTVGDCPSAGPWTAGPGPRAYSPIPHPGRRGRRPSLTDRGRPVRTPIVSQGQSETVPPGSRWRTAAPWGAFRFTGARNTQRDPAPRAWNRVSCFHLRPAPALVLREGGCRKLSLTTKPQAGGWSQLFHPKVGTRRGLAYSDGYLVAHTSRYWCLPVLDEHPLGLIVPQ